MVVIVAIAAPLLIGITAGFVGGLLSHVAITSLNEAQLKDASNVRLRIYKTQQSLRSGGQLELRISNVATDFPLERLMVWVNRTNHEPLAVKMFDKTKGTVIYVITRFGEGVYLSFKSRDGITSKPYHLIPSAIFERGEGNFFKWRELDGVNKALIAIAWVRGGPDGPTAADLELLPLN